MSRTASPSNSSGSPAGTSTGILSQIPGFKPPGFDRDPVVVPEAVANDLEPPPDVVLRPLFDALWNAAGWPRSPHYQGGRWQPPG